MGKAPILVMIGINPEILQDCPWQLGVARQGKTRGFCGPKRRVLGFQQRVGLGFRVQTPNPTMALGLRVWGS